MRVGDYVQVNPKKPSKPPDGRVTFLPMDAISEAGHITRRAIRNYDDVSNGYPGFADGDLLVAKITPCFENGKGALVTGLENSVGFGSTEFFVLRPSSSIEPRLLAHILHSEEFRRRGGSEMEGSAGQKRVSADFIRSFRFLCPESTLIQRDLADVLETADRVTQTYFALRDQLLIEKRALSHRLLSQNSAT